ncbi:hypothetical protein K0P33_13985 [Pseudomonas sp. ArH3a]|uniref:hypothetical protein n=1 Tax=Pseudomonas TaxID=286 RepID=UPI000BA12495|nr:MULTISPECIES: hypothetical protein [unclassified Pseudomonas]MCV2229327.1 hypothetical protein [Pseudomonas sp. AU10]OZO01024.1 hypothetical protein B7453_29065 [Pseudomonas sp. IB20]UNM22481.1 hypothetical protein K0P33_13985 [Pseudomonas sp. ArH3a]
MSYLETEINESLENLGIQNKKISAPDLDILITSIAKVFFCEGANFLDPIQLRVKRTEYNPNFWQEVSWRIQSDQLIFLVCDTSYRAWEIGPPQQLERILSDTTGYPFWVTDVSFSFLIYMDDHDCVSWA